MDETRSSEYKHKESESASYEGPGRTTIAFLNDDQGNYLIDSFSPRGFRINFKNSWIWGPMVLFHNTMLAWRVRDVFDINEASLSLFTVLDPVPELVVVGYGDRLKPIQRKSRTQVTEYDDDEEEEKRHVQIQHQKLHNQRVNEHIAKTTLLMKQKGLNVTFLPTDDAAATYNFLVGEDRLVACAAIPPSGVRILSTDTNLDHQLDYDNPMLSKNFLAVNAGEKGPWQGPGWDRK